MPKHDSSDLFETLRACQVLRTLSADQIEGLVGHSKMTKVRKGDILWLHGKGADYFGVLRSGLVKMTRSQGKGNDVTLELIGPNEAFGLVGTVDRQGCPLTAVAVMSSEVVQVPKAVILPYFEAVSAFKDGILFRLSARFKNNMKFNASRSGSKVDERLAATVMMLVESFGDQTASGSYRVRIPLTRQVIAEIAGTSTESAIRTLSAWRRKGWIETEKRHLVVPSLDPLHGILEDR